MKADALDDDYVFSESEKLEIEAKREVLRDVYGTAKPVKSFLKDGEAMLDEARKQLDSALSALEEGDLKAAYEAAVANAPRLVQRESNPDRFLFASNYDHWAAARSIANYWLQRQHIFGDRAYLPMDRTGKGALSPDVVEGMKKCKSFMVLPADRHRRPILFGDRSRVCSLCFQQKVRVQLFFYYLQLLFEDDEALQNGFVGIVCFNLGNREKAAAKTSDGTFHGPAFNIMSLVFSQTVPVKVNALHIVNIRSRSFMDSLLPSWLKMGELFQFGMPRVVIHFPHSSETAMSELLPYGILPKKTVKELGGTLDRDVYFEKWSQTVLKKEVLQYSKESPGQNLPVNLFETCADSELTVSSSDENADISDKPGDFMSAMKEPGDDAKNRKRKLDRMYQRNKREREKKLHGELTRQVNTLQEQNNSLKADQTSLIMLRDCAKNIVENITDARYNEDPTRNTPDPEAEPTTGHRHHVPPVNHHVPPVNHHVPPVNPSLIENLVRSAGLHAARSVPVSHLLQDSNSIMAAAGGHGLTNLPSQSHSQQHAGGGSTGSNAFSQLLDRLSGHSASGPYGTEAVSPCTNNGTAWQHLQSVEHGRIQERMIQNEISALLGLGARLPATTAPSLQSLLGSAQNPFSPQGTRNSTTSQEDRELLEALLKRNTG